MFGGFYWSDEFRTRQSYMGELKEAIVKTQRNTKVTTTNFSVTSRPARELKFGTDTH